MVVEKDGASAGRGAAGLAQVGLGVGLCIAATEVQRYAVLWRVGIGSPEERYPWLLVFIAAGFGALALLRRSGREPVRCTPVYLGVAAVACAGVVVRSVLTWQGGGLEGAAVRTAVGLAMEAPYFLMVFWANCLLGQAPRFSMKAVALGIVVAGLVQTLVSLLASSVVSYVLAALLAPIAALFLWSAARRLPAGTGAPTLACSDAPTCPDASASTGTPSCVGAPARTGAPAYPDAPVPASHEVPDGRVASRSRQATLLVLMGLLVVTASLVVYIIHAQWTGIQDGGAASLLVQVYAGLGMLAAGGVLYLASGRLAPHDLFDFCFMLVLPAAVAGLYLAMVSDGAMLAVSVIPLNIVYAALLFFVWSVPFICPLGMDRADLSLLAFFLKRAGVLVCPMVMAVFDALGVGLSGLVFGSIVALVALDAAYYLIAHDETANAPVPLVGPAGIREARGPVPQAGGDDRHVSACGRIAREHALTPREGEVLVLLGRGRTARHIGRELGMSDATVRTHISHIYRKLGVNSQQELLDVVERG